MSWLVFWTWSGLKSSFVGGVGRSVGKAGGQLDVIHGASIIKIIEPRQITSKTIERHRPTQNDRCRRLTFCVGKCRRLSPVVVLCRDKICRLSGVVVCCRRQLFHSVAMCRLSVGERWAYDRIS